MRRISIIAVNIFIIAFVSVAVIFYVGKQGVDSALLAEETFVDTTELVRGIADNYIADTSLICESWANHINASSMTMQEAIGYLRSAEIVDNNSVHVIWMDTYQGFSTEPMASNIRDYNVDYSVFSNLFDQWFVLHKIYLTRRYTDPMTGDYVIGFCKKIYLLDGEGKSRPAIMIRVVPVSYLETKWSFPSTYPDAGIGIINARGEYVIKPYSMKNENFFSYIYSFNQEEINQTELEKKLQESSVGSIKADNAEHISCTWVYRQLISNPDWYIVVAVPRTEIAGIGIDWTVPIYILIGLLSILFLDLFVFWRMRVRDLRVQKKLEEQGNQLMKALEEADRANHAKTAFLNNISHDIRTPMNAIIGFTTLANRHLEDPNAVANYLKKISVSSNHLLSLINDVLDMSRIESGKVVIEEAPCLVTDILEDIETIIHSDAQARQLRLDIRGIGIRHKYVYCDKLRINQVLLNLLSNSLKYTKAGGEVVFSIEELEQKREGYASYSFSVKDNGLGMKKEFLSHIFEPFEREKTSTISGIQGTGLGMAITKNIVDMMNGTIQVSSEEGKGTEVVVELELKIDERGEASGPEVSGLEASGLKASGTEVSGPEVSGPEVSGSKVSGLEVSGTVTEASSNESTNRWDMQAENEQPKKSASQEEIPNFAGKKILLVEDNELNREIAIEILSSLGIHVDSAEDGTVAVEKMKEYEKNLYDLILMDIQMPIMNGYEASEAIRKLPDQRAASIPIIAMTANAFLEDKKVAMEAGMNGHIAKPIDLDKLYRTLQQILG